MYGISYIDLPKKKSSWLRIAGMIYFGFGCVMAFAQPETEVFLMTLENTHEGLKAGDPKNISNNEGYDNQPSFYNDNIILFSSTRDGQTDIAAYALNKDSIYWKTSTGDGSEYSPLKIPGSADFSSVRLDVDGKQLLYRYKWKTGRSKPVVNELKVGYHVWYKPDILVSAVLVEDRMDLVVSNLKDNTNYTFQKNVGRSLHLIPNTRLVSFISKDQEVWELKSVDPVSGATRVITSLPEDVQDVCWLINGTVLAGKDNQILQYTPGKDTEWRLFAEFPKEELDGITRLATNKISGLLAMVAETPNKKP